MKKLIVCGFVLVSATSLAAQWPKVTDTTVPHAADGKINYDGASSVLDFDAHGDVKPDFGVFVFEKGQMNRKYVVKI